MAAPLRVGALWTLYAAWAVSQAVQTLSGQQEVLAELVAGAPGGRVSQVPWAAMGALLESLAPLEPMTGVVMRL